MWLQLILFVVSALLSAALKPKPQKPPAATLNDVNIPTIDQGTPVAVVFGTVWIDSWMVLWYGDLRNTPIKKKAGKK